jgi:hypothetical protein
LHFENAEKDLNVKEQVGAKEFHDIVIMIEVHKMLSIIPDYLDCFITRDVDQQGTESDLVLTTCLAFTTQWLLKSIQVSRRHPYL